MPKPKTKWPVCLGPAFDGPCASVVARSSSGKGPDPSMLCSKHQRMLAEGKLIRGEDGRYVTAAGPGIELVDEVEQVEESGVAILERAAGSRIRDVRARLSEDLSQEATFSRIVGALLATLDAEKQTRIRCTQCKQMTAAILPDSVARVNAARELLSQIVPRLQSAPEPVSIEGVDVFEMTREQRVELKRQVEDALAHERSLHEEMTALLATKRPTVAAVRAVVESRS